MRASTSCFALEPPSTLFSRMDVSWTPCSFSPLLSCFLTLSLVVDRAPPWNTAVELAAGELQSPRHLVKRVQRHHLHQSPPSIERYASRRPRQPRRITVGHRE